jgi:type IV pilus assembly protein PilB
MAQAQAQAPKPLRLGDWLLDRGLITQTQLDLALREQKRKGWLLGEALAQLGFVSQETLSQFLAQKTQTATIDLAATVIATTLAKVVPEALARRLLAVPVARDEEILTVAISDPLNVTAFDALEQVTRMRVNLVAAPEGDILLAIERLYASGQTVEEIVEELLKLGTDRLASTTEQDAPMIRLVDRILAEGVTSGSSDIHVHPEEKIVRIRMRRDGVLNSGYLAPKEVQPALIARLKIIGGMDIAESRRPQSGRANVSVASREVGLRLSTLPTAFGESVVLRILDKNNISLNLKALGFDPGVEQSFRSVLERPHGVILVTGPTGSGKTTTLYTALGLIDGTENSIFTLEDPVEYQLPLVRQTQINEAVNLTFAEGLRTLLRQDPDVILVGETRDTETAQLMIRAALTGHLVFTTLHTNDAIGAIPRLIDLGVEPYLLPSTIIGILAQRLVRKLCPNCRVPVTDPASKLSGLKVKLPNDLPPTLWEAGSCEQCQHTGYRGRVGVHEFFLMEPEYFPAITNGLDMPRLQSLAKERGFRTMFDDGLNKALRGLTSIEELLRLTQQ